MGREGEREALFLAIQQDPPEGESSDAKRNEKWTKVARRVFEAEDIEVAINGKRKTVRVDYGQGRVRAHDCLVYVCCRGDKI